MTPPTPVVMKADFRVCIDACVLANFGVADLLLRLAERPRQYLPIWSDEILEEVYRTHTTKLSLGQEMAESFGTAVRQHFPNALVSGHEHLVDSMTNHHKDRHVLAAAVHAQAELILTFNIKDFPEEALSPFGIAAKHPQDYLLTLYEMDDKQVASRIAATAAESGRDQEDILLNLGLTLPLFAARLLDDLDLA